jgi:hypothetical protein
MQYVPGRIESRGRQAEPAIERLLIKCSKDLQELCLSKSSFRLMMM